MNGFTSVKNSFIADARFTMAEKMVLIWLASKPADWQVRNEQVQKELSIGRDATTRLLRNLRDKGAITKPKPEQNSNGHWTRPPSQLAIRDEIRYVSAGRTELLESSGSVARTSADESLPRSHRTTGNQGFGSQGYTNKESESKSILDTPKDDQAGDMQTLRKAATPQADDVPPFMRDDNELAKPAEPSYATSADEHESEAEELRRLVRHAPTVKTLDSLWEHRKPVWTAELTELAKLRKAELLV